MKCSPEPVPIGALGHPFVDAATISPQTARDKWLIMTDTSEKPLQRMIALSENEWSGLRSYVCRWRHRGAATWCPAIVADKCCQSSSRHRIRNLGSRFVHQATSEVGSWRVRRRGTRCPLRGPLPTVASRPRSLHQVGWSSFAKSSDLGY